MNAEKSRLNKLLEDLQVNELKIPEKCKQVVQEIREKYDEDIKQGDQKGEEQTQQVQHSEFVNPFVPDRSELDEIDQQIRAIIAERRGQKPYTLSLTNTSLDPKRPWRTNTSKEKLLRINQELRRHHELSKQLIQPLPQEDLSELMKEGIDHSVDGFLLKEAVEDAKRSLPNFNYASSRKDSSSTLPDTIKEELKFEETVNNV